MSLDLAAKLKALREKRNNESSTVFTAPGTSTDPVSKPVPSNHTDSPVVESKEVPKVSSNTDLSILDISPDSIGKGTGDTGSQIAKVSESNASVSFADLEFFSKLDALEAMLLVPHPTMPVILRDIHIRLRDDPELVTTLTEEQIGIIVNGLKKQTNTELSGTVAKQSKARDKKVAIDISML